MKAACADPGSPFVFLDLRECQSELLGKRLLTHLEHDAPRTYALANVFVDRMRRCIGTHFSDTVNAKRKAIRDNSDESLGEHDLRRNRAPVPWPMR